MNIIRYLLLFIIVIFPSLTLQPKPIEPIEVERFAFMFDRLAIITPEEEVILVPFGYEALFFNYHNDSKYLPDYRIEKNPGFDMYNIVIEELITVVEPMISPIYGSYTLIDKAFDGFWIKLSQENPDNSFYLITTPQNQQYITDDENWRIGDTIEINEVYISSSEGYFSFGFQVDNIDSRKSIKVSPHIFGNPLNISP